QMVEHTHQEHEVPLLVTRGEIIHLHVPKLHTIGEAEFTRGPLRLPQEERLDVDSRDNGAALRQLEAVEAGVAADVERTPSGQLLGKVRRDLRPLESREVAERVVRG